MLPTIITAPLPDLCAAADMSRRRWPGMTPCSACIWKARFWPATKRGAHRADWVRDPDEAALDTLLNHEPLRAHSAPDHAGAGAAGGAGPPSSRLVAAGITVSLGHTDADAAQMRKAAAGRRAHGHACVQRAIAAAPPRPRRARRGPHRSAPVTPA